MKKRSYLLLIGFAVLVIVLAIFVNRFISSNRETYEGLKYTSKIMQQSIIRELENRKVPYRVSEGGFIYYHHNYKEIVKGIVRKVERHHSQELPRVSFSEREHEKCFLKLLQDATIPYKIKELDGKPRRYVVWDWEYNDKVQKLIKKVFDKIGITTQRARLTFQRPEEKEYFVNLLKEENIPYRLVKNKKLAQNLAGEEDIEYEWEYYDTVQKLIQKVYEKRIGAIQQHFSISFQDHSKKQHFLRLLKKENIPYKLGKIEILGLDIAGDEYIEWEAEHNKRVQRLIKEVKNKAR